MNPTGTNYFAFMCWIGLWSLVMHWILALTNACNALKYVTRFSCDIFGFYVAFIYLQKGIQILTRQGSGEEFYLSVMVSLLVLGFGYACGVIGDSPLFQHYVRLFVKDYGTPLTVVFFTGFCYFGAYLNFLGTQRVHVLTPKSHRQDGKCKSGCTSCQQGFLPHSRSFLVHSFLGY